MVSDPFLVGVFFGFVPAMGLLYILLREFQGFYQEKRLFRTFFIGMGVGLLLTLFETLFQPNPAAIEAGSLWFLVVYAGLFGLLEAGAFAVVLNYRTYRGKKDAPFYAVGFGLGFGATHVLVLVANLVASLGTQETGIAEVVFVTIIGLYFIGGILVDAAVGSWIGRAVSRGGLLPRLALAALTFALYLLGFYTMFRVPTSLALVSIALPFLGLAAGVALVAHAIQGILHHVVPPEVLREMEIHKRRVAREVVRTADGEEKKEP